MNIIIVGCGKVGQTLAEQLNEEGNNITVVDINAENQRSNLCHPEGSGYRKCRSSHCGNRFR